MKLKETPMRAELLYVFTNIGSQKYNSCVKETLRGNLAFQLRFMLGGQLTVFMENKMLNEIRKTP